MYHDLYDVTVRNKSVALSAYTRRMISQKINVKTAKGQKQLI